MEDSKAPGTDDISSDVYKIGGAKINNQLARFYKQILTEKKIPTAWKEAKIILLHKKGDKEDIKNYRPISLLSHVFSHETFKTESRESLIKISREQRGVLQGDTISPKIFTAAMEQIFKQLDLEKRGINIDGEWLTDLWFADDVALTSPSVETLEVQLNTEY
ncbi:uncharacterized protein [Amphiura filiformis]|uniref:uncharacterized protein n=1 Tax=Amphiura filiformis TaxID=82378 RepID=UPI003B223035